MARLTPLTQIAPLLRAPRYEVLPTAAAEQEVLTWVPRDLAVTVTASPARGLEPTIGLTERLAAHGYRVVPHLSARLVYDRAHLADLVARLTAPGSRTCSYRPATPIRPRADTTGRCRCWQT